MKSFVNILVFSIACLHLFFLVLEMFLWTKPLGLKIFRQSLERAKLSAQLAANQGLYNGFLAAGLLWSLWTPSAEQGAQLQYFFLGCVLVAGLYGAYSVSRVILLVQAFPAALAIIALFIS